MKGFRRSIVTFLLTFSILVVPNSRHVVRAFGVNPLQPTTSLLTVSNPSSVQGSSNGLIPDDNTTRPANRICKEYLDAFLNGTTDARDECEGMLNAYQAADCQEEIHNSRRLQGNDRLVEWHCCKVIHLYYSKHCHATSSVTDWTALGIAAVLVLCGILKGALRKYNLTWLLPEAGGCILVGIVLGALLHLIPNAPSWTEAAYFDNGLFLRILLPPIVFSAALTIQKREFFKFIIPILLYAIFGTLFCAYVTGRLVHHASSVGNMTTLPKLESYIFGALISSVDPIAILSVLQAIGMNDSDALYVVIFGESLLNDGIAIVLFETLVQYLDKSVELDPSIVWHVAKNFILVVLASVAIGCIAGALSAFYYWALQGYQHPVVEVALFFCWALIPYYISDGLGFSGIVALVATGFVMDIFVVGGTGILNTVTVPRRSSNTASYMNPISVENVGGGSNHVFTLDDGVRYMNFNSDDQSENISIVQWHRHYQSPVFSNAGHLSTEARVNVKFVSEVIAILAETAIFAYLGFFLFGNNYKWDAMLSLSAIVACVVSRAVMVVVFGVMMKTCIIIYRAFRGSCRSASSSTSSLEFSRVQMKQSSFEQVLDWRNQTVLILAGLRGAVSFALVENIPLYNVVTQKGSQYKAELKAMTSATILCTVFFFGGFTSLLVKQLGLTNKRVERKDNQSFSDELEDRLIERTQFGLFS